MSYATPAYWNAAAQRCKGFANEGACLARVARRAPGGITIVPGFSGLGQTTGQDIGAGAQLIVGLISNPEATLRVQGPRIVTALDTYIVGPVVQAAVQRSTPYILRYLTPPLTVMYIMMALSTWFSYEVLVQSRRGALRANRGRRRHRR